VTISIRQHLENLNGDLLKGLLSKLRLKQKGLTRKAQIAEAIEKQLINALPDFLSALTETEKFWLAESAHQDKFVSASEFAAKFGTNSPWVRSDSSSWSSRRERSPLEALVYCDPYTRKCFLVSEMVGPLTAALPKPATIGVRTVAKLPLDAHNCVGSDGKPLQVFESERIAPAELARVIRLVQAGKIKTTDSTQRPTDASTRVIGEALIAPDFALEEPAKKREWGEPEKAGPVRAHAWGVLLQQCGWAKPKGGALVLTSDGQRMLQGFNAEAYRAGVEKFLCNGDFDELHRVNHLRGQTGKCKRWISDPALRKDALAEVLATFPPGEWLEYKEAFRMAQASGEDWNVMDGEGFLYICDAQYGLIYDHAGVNSQFFRALLMESLATLGLVDIAFVYPHGEWPDLRDNWGSDSHSFCGRYDGLRYLRLTGLGAFCLGTTDTYTLSVGETQKLFRVLPNLEIILSNGHLDAANRALLELLAEPRGDMVWALDSERILTHVETGGSFNELQQFLEANAAEGLPENVRVWLTELESKLAACKRASRATLLEWADEPLARLISTSAGLNKLCHHAGGNRIVVAHSDYRAFARAVKKLGYVAPAGQ
jgi:hypothetical protein